MTHDCSSELPPEPSHRSAHAWLILLSAWSIGLLIWTIYIAVYVYVVVRVLA